MIYTIVVLENPQTDERLEIIKNGNLYQVIYNDAWVTYSTLEESYTMFEKASKMITLGLGSDMDIESMLMD